MIRNDREYLERRAEDELELAQRASHPAAVRAHYELLGYYLDRLYSADGGNSGRTPSPLLG
jgi:hypothetical protein